MSDQQNTESQNTQGTPGAGEESDPASGGAPERPDESKAAHTTDEAADDSKESTQL